MHKVWSSVGFAQTVLTKDSHGRFWSRQLVECWPGVRCRPPDAQDSSRYDAFLELRVISHPTNIACKVDIDRQVAIFQIDLGIPYLRSLKPRRQEIYQEVWFRWCSLGAFNQFNCVYTSRINSFISPAATESERARSGLTDDFQAFSNGFQWS